MTSRGGGGGGEERKVGDETRLKGGKGWQRVEKKGRNDVESSFVVIFAPPARKNSKRRKKEERERERGEKKKERKEGKEEREKEKGERVFLPGGVSHERSATIKRLRPR